MLSLNYYDLFFGVFKPGCAILKLFIQTIFVHATHVRSTCGVIKIRTLYECKGIIFSRFVGGFFGWILSTWFHQEVSCKRWVNLPNSNTSKSTVGIMWQTLGGGRTDVRAFAHYFSQSSLSWSHWWQQSFVITILSIESYNNSKRVSTSLLYIYF